MRKAIDGLSALTREVLLEDPTNGHLFVFCNRARNRIKILYFEDSGFWLLHKRLERGRFTWPGTEKEDDRHLVLEQAELMAILGGIDFSGIRRKDWYRVPEQKEKRNGNKRPAPFVIDEAWEQREQQRRSSRNSARRTRNYEPKSHTCDSSATRSSSV